MAQLAFLPPAQASPASNQSASVPPEVDGAFAQGVMANQAIQISLMSQQDVYCSGTFGLS